MSWKNITYIRIVNPLFAPIEKLWHIKIKNTPDRSGQDQTRQDKAKQEGNQTRGHSLMWNNNVEKNVLNCSHRNYGRPFPLWEYGFY